MDKWPAGQEQSPEEIVRQIRELAAGAARATEEEYQAAKGAHLQFGDNFYRLFLALSRGRSDSQLSRTDWERIEKFGDNLQRFVRENSELLDKINTALEQQQVYSKMFRKINKLLVKKEFELVEQISEELKVGHIGIAAWNKLNPLLEEAAAKMKEYGMNPEDFFGEG